MRYSFPLRAFRWFGVMTALATIPAAAAFGQAANPLGVEWAGGGTANPAQAPAANNPLGVEWVGGARENRPAPAADNPLGVEWVGGGTNATRPAPPPANNPLGVEWVGGDKQGARPAPAPTSGDRSNDAGTPRPLPQTPRPPAPSEPSPPAPQTPQPPAPVRPAPEGARPPSVDQSDLAAALADSWSYQAVAFSDGSGTISETRGVSGTLTFKPDGRYEQALYIGGIANVMKGSYRIAGGRLETTYLWRGEPVTDIFDLYLDPTGKRLTLTGLGSPRSLYTLQRVE